MYDFFPTVPEADCDLFHPSQRVDLAGQHKTPRRGGEGGRGEIGKISHTIMHALLSPFTPHTDRIPHENKSIRVYMCSAASLCAQIEKKENNRVRVAESSQSYFISTSTPTSALNFYRYLKKLKTKMYNKFKNKSF